MSQSSEQKIQAASKNAEYILDDMFSEHGDDTGIVAYVLWINLVHFLVFTGISPQQLVQDCIWHAEEETIVGHA